MGGEPPIESFRRNFLIITHGDCIGSVMGIMPVRGSQKRKQVNRSDVKQWTIWWVVGLLSCYIIYVFCLLYSNIYESINIYAFMILDCILVFLFCWSLRCHCIKAFEDVWSFGWILLVEDFPMADIFWLWGPAGCDGREGQVQLYLVILQYHLS